MTKQLSREVELNKLGDDELLSLLGWLYDTVRDLEEARKKDEVIEQYKAKIAEYAEEKYVLPIKDYRKNLSAARYIAKLRGLEFKVPERDDV